MGEVLTLPEEATLTHFHCTGGLAHIVVRNTHYSRLKNRVTFAQPQTDTP